MSLCTGIIAMADLDYEQSLFPSLVRRARAIKIRDRFSRGHFPIANFYRSTARSLKSAVLL